MTEDKRDQKDPVKPEKSGGELYRVKIVHSSEIEICSSSETFAKKEIVLVQSRYGKDLGCVLGLETRTSPADKENVFSIIRAATDADIKIYEDNKTRERDAFAICKEKIAHHKLEMKLVSAHYLVAESKVLFFFTAEARVDFRELVKDLVSVFKMRIELRQIGVRDESRVLGGMAVCGRAYCCHSLTDKLRPVSIKMAKEQNLSLNSMKISGPCGRLLCCLSYEYDFYHDGKSRLPPAGCRISRDNVVYRVSDVNLLAREVTLSAPENRIFKVPFDSFSYDKKNEKWIISTDLVPEV